MAPNRNPTKYMITSSKNYDQLKFSPAVETDVKEKRVNPKRMQREVHKSVAVNGIGTKSQQALKLQQEQMKTKRKAKSREQKRGRETAPV